MSYELYIAKRYLKSKKRTKFVSLITYISIFGIIIGVASLIIVLSVMNGLEKEIRSRFIGADAHIHVRTFHNNGIKHYGALTNQIRNIRHIKAITPYINEKALIKSKANQTGIIVRGISPESAKDVIDIEKNLIYGTLELDKPASTDDTALPGIVLGFELSKRLQVIVGDQVSVWSYKNIKRYGDIPQFKMFRIVGYFETGLYEFDDQVAYISVNSAQKLFNMNKNVTGLWLKLDHYSNSQMVADEIRKTLGYPYEAITWKDMNPNLFAWMQIEKWAAFIILSLIITVAAFNIISTLIMVTLEKTREIGILKSMGASSSGIKRIFMYQGLIVGITGTILGIVIGFLLCYSQQKFKFFALPEDVYIISWLPIFMQWSDFLLIGVVSTVISFLASVYPAMRAARLNPVAAIRYE